ncbi:MAG: hypothetical protein AAFU69_05835 [Pseudomonadota bacterium]
MPTLISRAIVEEYAETIDNEVDEAVTELSKLMREVMNDAVDHAEQNVAAKDVVWGTETIPGDEIRNGIKKFSDSITEDDLAVAAKALFFAYD